MALTMSSARINRKHFTDVPFMSSMHYPLLLNSRRICRNFLQQYTSRKFMSIKIRVKSVNQMISDTNPRRFHGFATMAGRGVGDDTQLFEEESPMKSFTWPDLRRERICILGGGFGGLYTALRLESLLWPSDKRPQILIVDQSDRFVFKPMLYEILSGEVDAYEIAPYFSELLANTGVLFCKDKVKAICPCDSVRSNASPTSGIGGIVHLESGMQVEYDWLVLALGAGAKMNVPGASEFAIPFSSLEDTLKVDKHLRTLERKKFGKGQPPIRVIVVGSGYCGVELAATVAERLADRGKVQVVNVASTICPSAPASNREAALKVLQARDVQFFLGYFVKSVRKSGSSKNDEQYEETSVMHKVPAGEEEDTFLLDLQPAERGGQSQILEADLVLWTVGSKPQIPSIEGQAFPLNGMGQVEIEETLKVKGYHRTFAVGDLAGLRDPSGRLLPSTAQVAFQQADFAGWNLWAAINNRPLLPFRFQNLGELMTLGKNDAVCTLNFQEGLVLEDRVGYAARKLAYLYRMPTDAHRIKVGLSWLAKSAVDSIASLQSTIAQALES
ncbi:hypothetical protein SUGI_1073170 [Cryptomeria japonica]|uniref:alternative NAD(P)H-ubiquinone oxidoreductase C1, chloroplastic/mitochondrial isoform X2 n=1 Tax=Cryptomeria japonica TaxID=3369 RepID=UPI002414A369|nr:alternative NAD(P)H-ubiquinone oxidoreductase C1, chloroplastic/mitochondrial isoform X2 [Cryptomeria japonica]GLJ50363.1 hypothetical protein SUGI_1073170 [Cryptomeria japonica]